VLNHTEKTWLHADQTLPCSTRSLQINSLYFVLFYGTLACGWSALFHYFIIRLAAFHYLVTARVNSPITFLTSVFIFYIARITQSSKLLFLPTCYRSTLIHELTASHHNMCEKLENNGRIWKNGTSRAGSNQMWIVDGEQKIFLEWPKYCILYPLISVCY